MAKMNSRQQTGRGEPRRKGLAARDPCKVLSQWVQRRTTPSPSSAILPSKNAQSLKESGRGPLLGFRGLPLFDTRSEIDAGVLTATLHECRSAFLGVSRSYRRILVTGVWFRRRLWLEAGLPLFHL
jgi:hypothetical protein